MTNVNAGVMPRSSSQVREPAPVPEQVALGQDEPEGRFGQGPRAGRGGQRLHGVLSVGGGRPAEDHQDGDDDGSPYRQVH
jgi:hypothetical protein